VLCLGHDVHLLRKDSKVYATHSYGYCTLHFALYTLHFQLPLW
jgi:hypothetical protein